MRVAFLGSPAFSVPALRALAQQHDVAVVLAQPPRPAGRGQATQACPVHRAALELGIPVRTPARLRGADAELAAFQDLGLDVAVVAAYGLILPKAWLEAPRRGCLNIHASLLPRWRGASPIQTAILEGDAETGITIMRMDEGLDTGPMLLSETTPIGPDDTAATLHDRLSEIGSALILRALAEDPVARPQPAEGVTHAAKLDRSAGRIDWTQTATAIERRVRAFTPWPGTEFGLPCETVKLLAARALDETTDAPPGTLLDDRPAIACGGGSVLLAVRLQRPGRPGADAAAVLRGMRLPPGTRAS